MFSEDRLVYQRITNHSLQYETHKSQILEPVVSLLEGKLKKLAAG